MKEAKKNTISNSKLTITINDIGAEICSIKDINNTEYMWQGDPEIWGSTAPVLFPIIGALKNGKTTIEEKSYPIPKHGMVRHNENLIIDKHANNAISYSLVYNNDTLELYPYKFKFTVSYTLVDSAVQVTHTVENLDDKTLYFSTGGHPAFKCPIHDDEHYEDYEIEFEQKESENTFLLSENGLLNGEEEALLKQEKSLPLTHELFENDALILKTLKSEEVYLSHKTKGRCITIKFKDYNYLGIWAKPEGDFVCIEPWLGVTDSENTKGDFIKKEGIIPLQKGKTFKATYSIEIH